MADEKHDVLKAPALRVGLALEDGKGFKHLLTLAFNGDGGIMVTPALHAPRWSVTAQDMSGETVDKQLISGNTRPKLVPVVEDGLGLQPWVAVGDGMTGHQGQAIAEGLGLRVWASVERGSEHHLHGAMALRNIELEQGGPTREPALALRT